MKLLIISCFGLLFLSFSNADTTNYNQSDIDAKNSLQCVTTLHYLTHIQREYIQGVQKRLKQQQTLAEENDVLLAQTAIILRDPDVGAKIRKNPEKMTQIIKKAVEDCQQMRQKRAELAQIRENFPQDELLKLC